MQKIVINTCFGGFGLSDDAYEKLIEWGVPVREYIKQERDPRTKLYLDEPSNNGKVIFDRTLSDKKEGTFDRDRYWEVWLSDDRTNPLLIRVVEELGDTANGSCANLKITEIPNDVKYEIDEYDGLEHIAEEHRTWR